jgi:pSer/pThr/pTyr-binding forkhead associated (FHA) protein
MVMKYKEEDEELKCVKGATTNYLGKLHVYYFYKTVYFFWKVLMDKLTDLKSSYGTFLDGKKCNQGWISLGSDCIKVLVHSELR